MGMQTSRKYDLSYLRMLGAQSIGENPPLFRQGFAICVTRLGGLFFVEINLKIKLE